MKTSIQPVKGTTDFYPPEMAIRTWLYQEIRGVSESFGYQEYEGPLLESLELYAAKSGEELVKEQSFVFQDRSGNYVTLRPELTPTLARLIAQRQRQLAYPVRWWSFGPMWRYEQPQRGRTREFFQWNIDLLGVDSPETDAEIVAVGAEFLRRLGLEAGQVRILVNNRRLMDAELARLGLPEAMRPQIFRLIDRLDRMSAGSWEDRAREAGLSTEQLIGLRALLEDDELWKRSSELQAFFEALEAMGVLDYVRYKPTIIRGLDYYTGTVFECYDVAGKFRAIFAGGRYDDLVADVGGDPLPGVGFAMGDKVIQLVLEKFGLLPDLQSQPQAQIVVTIFDEARRLPSFRLASDVRRAGFSVALYPEEARLAKQFKYADRINAQVALVLGPDEVERGLVTVKDLRSRDQTTVSREELIRKLRELLVSARPS
jgi:histidyl-tRNA synthetase